jgi:hypothetical protein
MDIAGWLQITGFAPGNGAREVNPGTTVAVRFDQALDPAVAAQVASCISVEPPVTFQVLYDDPTHTLSIVPHPYLASSTEYHVTLSAELKGVGGCCLNGPQSLCFTTGDLPAGDMTLGEGCPYTAVTEVTVNPQPNAKAGNVRFSVTDSLEGIAWAPCGPQAPPLAISLPAGDGEKWVYYQFTSDPPAASLTSPVRRTGVILDTLPPALIVSDPLVDGLPTLYWNSLTSSLTPHAAAADPTSGVADDGFCWSSENPGVLLTPAHARQPLITMSEAEDGSCTISVSACDRAGNQSQTLTLRIIKDTAAPARPVVDAKGTSWYWSGRTLSGTPAWAWVGDPSETQDYEVRLYCLTPEKLPQGFRTIFPSASVPLAVSVSSSPYIYAGGSQALPDSTYSLEVRHRDKAGNLSDPPVPGFPQLIVTPVLPVDGDTRVSPSTALDWRAFSTSNSYHVRIGTNPQQPGTMAIYQAAVGSDGAKTWTPQLQLAVNTQYFWEIVDNQTGTRLPADSAAYFTFRTGVK